VKNVKRYTVKKVVEMKNIVNLVGQICHLNNMEMLTFDELNSKLDNNDLKQCKRCLVEEIYCINAPLFRKWSNWGKEEERGYFSTKINQVSNNGLCSKCQIEVNKFNYDKLIGRDYKCNINNYMSKIKDEIIKNQEDVDIDLAYEEYVYVSNQEAKDE
jgi:hypothetical protein